MALTDQGTTGPAAKTSDPVIIHTDGSCLSNPGPGGWAAILQWQDKEREISGAEPDSTNNRMELTAAINGLNAVTRPMTIDLYTDSKYVMTGVTDWMPRWKGNGWKTAAKKPVANQDLWQQLDSAVSRHQVRWHWVKGHAGNPLNERCDKLARSAAESLV
jgi:ribonuclease HI